MNQEGKRRHVSEAFAGKFRKRCKLEAIVKHTSPHILLINPWITDFAAYNFWIKPLGLLYIASLLKGKWVSSHV